jgi:hypothetical protein
LLLDPSQELVESRAERLPPLGEAILDPRRDFSVHSSRDDAVALQLPKLLRVPYFRVRSCGVVVCQICSTSMSISPNAPPHLPPPIAAYFAADTSDATVVARCFSESAVVIDERREHRGKPAIERWRAEALAKYHYTSEPLAVDVAGPEVTVTARVTGDFPGSPVTLQYHFTLEGVSIARLEITA